MTYNRLYHSVAAVIVPITRTAGMDLSAAAASVPV
jgi:hypothetical protein